MSLERSVQYCTQLGRYRSPRGVFNHHHRINRYNPPPPFSLIPMRRSKETANEIPLKTEKVSEAILGVRRRSYVLWESGVWWKHRDCRCKRGWLPDAPQFSIWYYYYYNKANFHNSEKGIWSRWYSQGLETSNCCRAPLDHQCTVAVRPSTMFQGFKVPRYLSGEGCSFAYFPLNDNTGGIFFFYGG